MASALKRFDLLMYLNNKSKRFSIQFQSKARNDSAKYSRFLKNNTAKLCDISDAEIDEEKIRKLIAKFASVFDVIAKPLAEFKEIVEKKGV